MLQDAHKDFNKLASWIFTQPGDELKLSWVQFRKFSIINMTSIPLAVRLSLPENT